MSYHMIIFICLNLKVSSKTVIIHLSFRKVFKKVQMMTHPLTDIISSGNQILPISLLYSSIGNCKNSGEIFFLPFDEDNFFPSESHFTQMLLFLCGQLKNPMIISALGFPNSMHMGLAASNLSYQCPDFTYPNQHRIKTVQFKLFINLTHVAYRKLI